MPITKSIARPYAKAAFEYALEHDNVPAWSEFLKYAAQFVRDDRVKHILQHPEVTAKEAENLMLNLCRGQMDSQRHNFIMILATNRRLTLLPDIATLYENQRKEQEQAVSVNIITAMALNSVQKEKLLQALKIRLQRIIISHFRVDPSLLGGVIIHAGDFVIDGSVRGKLDRLKLELEA
jgi:F-type H+-transporting ATPase subunit delta